MRIVLFFALILSSKLLMSAEFVYSSYSIPIISNNQKKEIKFDSIYLDNDIDEWIMARGDVILPMEFRENENGWSYVNTPYFSLSLKNEWTKIPKNWLYNEVNYKCVGNANIEVMGNLVKVSVIHSISSNWRGFIYYSEQKGIAVSYTHLTLPTNASV